jgi:plasmid stabilization system protein ParE
MIDSGILPIAQAEYESAVDWYLDKSPAAASRFVAEVETAIDAIRKYPDRFPRWDDLYRFYLLDTFPYYVAYRLTSDGIAIVAIRHGAQDQDAWQGR